jgi:hypothetical protein
MEEKGAREVIEDQRSRKKPEKLSFLEAIEESF